MTVFEQKRVSVMSALLGTLTELRRADEKMVPEVRRYFIHLTRALLCLKANSPEGALRHTTAVHPAGGGLYERLARGAVGVIVACCAQSTMQVDSTCHQQQKTLKTMRTLREFADSNKGSHRTWWRIG